MKCRCRKVSRTVNIEKYVREDYDYENEDDILDICDMYSDNINIKLLLQHLQNPWKAEKQ